MSLSTAVLAIDRDHVVIEWNRACEDLTGIKREDVIGTKYPWKGFYNVERPVLADFVVDGDFTGVEKYYESFRTASHVRGGYTAENWIQARGRMIYIIFTACPVTGPDGEVIGAVETLEDITGLKNAQLALEELAVKDPLTGLHNRRFLMDALKAELDRAERYSAPTAIAMIDLDFFKNVNDSHGHDAGDLVLKRFSEIMTRGIRKTDICGRIGGEEFLIIFPNSTVRSTEIILERLRSGFSGEIFASDSGERFSVTASIGAAGHSAGIRTVDDFLKKADMALYRAKETGRNRICLDGG